MLYTLLFVTPCNTDRLVKSEPEGKTVLENGSAINCLIQEQYRRCKLNIVGVNPIADRRFGSSYPEQPTKHSTGHEAASMVFFAQLNTII